MALLVSSSPFINTFLAVENALRMVRDAGIAFEFRIIGEGPFEAADRPLEPPRIDVGRAGVEERQWILF